MDRGATARTRCRDERARSAVADEQAEGNAAGASKRRASLLVQESRGGDGTRRRRSGMAAFGHIFVGWLHSESHGIFSDLG